MVSRISEPLKTKRRHGKEGGGRRASGGSLYFNTIVVFATVFVSAASLPVGAKLGFCFSASGGAVMTASEIGYLL